MSLSYADGVPHAAWFSNFGANPDSSAAERGACLAAEAGVDSIIALGGGSSLDCAKAINFLLTNGGSMRDYRGYAKARKPMLPMIGIPTTAGTGSEAQSYAVISDAETKTKMACGDPKAAFAITILDPELTRTVPDHGPGCIGIRCHFACGRDSGDEAPQRAVADLHARGMEAPSRRVHEDG